MYLLNAHLLGSVMPR